MGETAVKAIQHWSDARQLYLITIYSQHDKAMELFESKRALKLSELRAKYPKIREIEIRP